MKTLEERINQLEDQQVLSIVASLSGEFSTDETPEGKEAQISVLQSVLSQCGQELDFNVLAEMDTPVAAGFAKELLLLMSQSPEIRQSLEAWLDQPPVQEEAALPLILTAPIVFTGCLTFLYVVGHIKFVRRADGKYEFIYDSAKTTPIDSTYKDIVKSLANLMKKFIR